MRTFYLTLLLCLSTALFAQKQKYSKAKIYLDGKEKKLHQLSKLGLAVDHGEHKQNTFFISDFSEQEIALLKTNGFQVDILIDDVSAFYSNRNKSQDKNILKSSGTRSTGCSSSSTIATPSNFQLGSMGGFYTYTEMLAILDNMASQYPNLISVKQPISNINSVEGRPLYWLKISDNPGTDETEPEILYTALHHSREPASLSQMIFYMYYLLENYGTNAEITALINNTEMYFIPCVNPDGYVYNETTDPSGGGLWRKNRRNNNDGTYGVDLNRNYGYQWAFDDDGSSPTTSDETFRGIAAFSEPETQAVRWFCEQHEFKMAINYHSYGNDLIYPWGYIANLYTPDSAVFESHTKLMTSYNHFTAGTGNQTVMYVTNGDADDWCYGEQTTKSKILSMTPEVGSAIDGFWPAQENIITICENSLWQNIFAAELIGKYARAKDLSPYAIDNVNGYFNYSVQRLGLDSPATYTVSIVPLDNWITTVGPAKTYSSMSLLETKTDSISYAINPSIAGGQVFRYILKVNNGLYDKNDTISKIFGQIDVAFSSNNSTISGYTASGGNWGTSTAYYTSAPSSITDSPNGNYNDNTNKILKLITAIDLSTALSANLSFWARWDIEAEYDYVQVMASIDGGNSWTPMCGKYTNPGSQDQDFENPLYDGQQLSWVKEEISLDDYIGTTIHIGFKMVSDQAVDGDGFYFDDLSVNRVNSLPSGVMEKDNKNALLQNVPNPASENTSIHFTLQNIRNPVLSIYNVMGELVHKEMIKEKQTSVLLDLSSFANGTYFYQVSGEGYSSEVLKMVVLK
ncbi:MAG: M14 family zinc carboxypeptidase [Bacteroidia bacterium]